MTLSVLTLLLGVIAYGLAGARLAVGARHEGGALASRAWWLGTGLQTLGFLLTFVARRDLPLLFVQATVVSALAVTALVQHLSGVRRFAPLDWAAVAAVVAGIAALGTATVPGPTAAVTWVLVALLNLLLTLVLFLTERARSGVWLGLLSGVGFGVGAIFARLVVGQAASATGGAPWEFWTWSLERFLAAALVVAGIAAGQWALTRGLALRDAVPVLGAMYAASTFVPAVVGIAVLGESPAAGSWPLVVVGLALAVLGSGRLLRFDGALPH